MQAPTSSLQLDEEIAQVQEKVRYEPTQPKWRMGLFQRYAQVGKWEKAIDQLDIYARMSPEGKMFAVAYRVAVEQEQVREQVFKGTAEPTLPKNAPQWLKTLAQALQQGLEAPEVADMRAFAFDEAPTASGSIDEQAFEWIADADSRLGPVCEVITDGKYQWIPFDSFESIRIIAPTNACDLVWLSAGITLKGGVSTPALIPARYPLALTAIDGHLRSALTTWDQVDEETWIGHGVRMITTDSVEKSILDIRRIDFNVAAKE